MNSEQTERRNIKGKDALIAVLVIGSLWGLSEALMGQVIREIALPLRAGLLTGIGMGCMGFFLGMTGKLKYLPFVALVTMVTTQLCVPVLQCSVLCKANTSLAVILHGISLAGVAAIAGNRMKGSLWMKSGVAFTAALASATVFYFGGMNLAPCNYLLSFNHSFGLVSFLMKEGLVWGLFCMVLFPAGYYLGERSFRGVDIFRETRPVLCYGSSALVVLVCWISIAVSVAG